MKVKNLESDFAVLDIKKGRRSLLQACKRGESTKVTITGFIEEPWGDDDGVSQEFTLNIRDISIVQ